MGHLFISYAREDVAFVRRLSVALQAVGRDVWVDLEGITPAAEFWPEIQAAIDAADALVFVASPSSAASIYCRREVDHAVEGGKRLIPIVVAEVDPESLHEAIAVRNWIDATDDGSLDLAIRQLLEAVDIDLDWVRAHARLLFRAQEWNAAERNRTSILRGRELEDAERRLAAAERDPEPTLLMKEYVVAGRRAASRTQRIRVGLSLGAAAIASILAIMAILSSFEASKNETEAQEAAAQARHQELLATSRAVAASGEDLLDRNFAVGALTALQAHDLSPTFEAERSVYSAARRNPEIARILSAESGPVYAVAHQPGGTLVAAGTQEGEILLWDIEDLDAEPSKISAGDEIADVAFSADGTELLAADVGASKVSVWSVAERSVTEELPLDLAPLSVALSDDGRYLAVGTIGGAILAIDTADDQSFLLTAPPRRESGQRLADPIFSIDIWAEGDEALLVAGANVGPVVWDLGADRVPSTQRVLVAEWEHFGTKVTFAPRGDAILAGTDGGQAYRLDLRTEEVTPLEVEAQLFVYSGDGSALYAVANEDGDVQIMNPDTFKRDGQPLEGHSGAVSDIAVDEDGEVIFTASDDGSVIVWDVARFGAIGLRMIGSIAADFSPVGDLAAVATDTGVDLIDPTTFETIRVIEEAARGSRTALAFDPSGAILAVGDESGSVTLWDVEEGTRIGAVGPHDSLVLKVGFSPDGRTLFTMGIAFDVGNELIVWDVEERRRLGTWGGDASDAAFLTDGRLAIATGTTLELVDARTLEADGEPLHDPLGEITNVSVDPSNEEIVATGGSGGAAQFWNVLRGERIGDAIEAHASPIRRMTFSPEGSFLASGAQDGTIVLWDVETARPLVQSADCVCEPGLPTFPDDIGSIEFSTLDGTLAVGSYLAEEVDLFVPLWLPEVAKERLCAAIGRNLTQDEWDRYIGFGERVATCPRWPLDPA